MIFFTMSQTLAVNTVPEKLTAAAVVPCLDVSNAGIKWFDPPAAQFTG
jgi:hypothetical protein